MATKLNYKKMGADEATFKNASIKVVKEDAPIVNFINSTVIEDVADSIKVVKEERGTLRPYLVLYNKILHARTAMYMTSSLPLSRIEAENKIWGYHLVKTPQNLYNYIDVSAVKGGVKDKVSVIDKDRFFFITQDSLEKETSTALAAENLEISLNMHYNLVNQITSTLEKDFPPEYAAHIISLGSTQRWTYTLKNAQPILYNPSSMYLAMYLNAGAQITNTNFALTPEDLLNRSKTLILAADAYNDYIAYHKKLAFFANSSAKLYKAYKNARYYADLISERTYKKMQEADKLASGDASWKYLVGKTKSYEKLNIEERLEEALLKEGIKGKELITAKEQLLKLYQQERALNFKTISAVSQIIEDVNRVKRENIDLSSFPFNMELVGENSFGKNEYKALIEKRYKKLTEEFKARANERRSHQLQRKTKLAEKQLAQEYEELANEYAINQLKATLKKVYIGQFDRAYKQYSKGQLIQSEEELEALYKVTDMPSVYANYLELVKTQGEVKIGGRLAARMMEDFNSLSTFSSYAKTWVEDIKQSQNQIKALSVEDEVIKADELFSAILAETTKEQIGADKRGKKVDPALILDKVLTIDENSVEFTSVDLTYGSKEREYLANMQSIVNSKSSLRALSQIKETREAVLNAVISLNQPQLLTDYADSVALISGTKDAYFKTNNLKKPKTLEEINQRVNMVLDGLTKPKTTKIDYNNAVAELSLIKKEMDEVILGYGEQRKWRAYFSGALASYDFIKENTKNKLGKTLERVHLEVIKKLKNDSNCLVNLDVNDGDHIVMKDKKGHELFDLTKEQIKEGEKSFLKANKNCFDVNNFSSPKRTEAIILEAFEKCFPDPKIIEEAIFKKTIGAESPKKAAKIYQQAGDTVRNQKEKLDDFIALVAQVGYDTLSIQQENLVLLNNFGLMIEIMASDLRDYMADNYRVNGEEIKGEAKVMDKAITRGEKDLKQKAKDDFNEYVENLYKNIEEVIESLPPRIDLEINLDDYFRTRRPGKPRTVKNAQMPQSVLGGNGISEVMQTTLNAKRNHTIILSELVTGQEVHSDAMYNNVLSCTAGFIKGYTDRASDELYSKLNGSYRQDIVETIRLFALESRENEAFLNKKEFMPRLLNIYKELTKGKTNRKHTSSVKFLKEFEEAAKVAVKVLNSKERLVKQGDKEPMIDDLLKKLVNIYKENFGDEFV